MELRNGRWWRLAGVGAVGLLPVTIAVAVAVPQLSLASTLLLLLFEVVLVALVAPLWVAVLCAVGAVLAANWFLTEPQHTLFIDDPSEVVSLVVFVVTAVLAGVLVSRTLSAVEWAARSRVETQTYRSLVTGPAASSEPEVALSAILELLALDEVELRDRSNRTIAAVSRPNGPAGALGTASVEHELPDGFLLLGNGPMVAAADDGLVASLGTAAVRLHQNHQLALRAERTRP